MKKINVKMKIENISLTEEDWQAVDKIQTMSSSSMPRDIFLGTMINIEIIKTISGLEQLVKGKSIEQVTKKIGKEFDLNEKEINDVTKKHKNVDIKNMFNTTI